jgi:hypothetical protein
MPAAGECVSDRRLSGRRHAAEPDDTPVSDANAAGVHHLLSEGGLDGQRYAQGAVCIEHFLTVRA